MFRESRRVVNRVVFLSLEGNKHSRTRNYYNGLEKRGFAVSWIELKSLVSLKRRRNQISQLLVQGYVPVVASPSHILVIPFFLTFWRRPVLDAGWLLSDGVVASRREFGFIGLKAVKFFALDFLVLHLASKVFLESEAQSKRVRRKFFVSSTKLCVLFTGVDENRFGDLSTRQRTLGVNTSNSKKVLFRGGAQAEAGHNVLWGCLSSGSLKGGVQITISTRGYSAVTNSPQVSIVDRYLSDFDLAQLFSNSDLVLGQLSNHKRLRYTIPHKFFEAALFGKPYLSSDKGVVGGFEKLKIVYLFQGGSPEDLANSINQIFDDFDSALKVGNNLRKWYEENASQSVLSDKLISFLSGD